MRPKQERREPERQVASLCRGVRAVVNMVALLYMEGHERTCCHRSNEGVLP